MLYYNLLFAALHLAENQEGLLAPVFVFFLFLPLKDEVGLFSDATSLKIALKLSNNSLAATF